MAPLSPDELHTLREIERALHDDDPALTGLFGRTRWSDPAAGRGAAGRAVARLCAVFLSIAGVLLLCGVGSGDRPMTGGALVVLALLPLMAVLVFMNNRA
jgi:hypothetical protein